MTGNAAVASQRLAEMVAAGVHGDVVVYCGVLDACAKASDLACAKDVFRQMKAAQVPPNVVAYATLGRLHAHAGNWQEVELLAKEMQEKEGLAMNEHFLYVLLLSYAVARPRQEHRAEKAYLYAKSAGVKMNKHLVGVLGRAVGRARCHQLLHE